MVLVVGLDAVDEGQPIGVFAEVGEQFREVMSAVAMLLELEGAADDRVRKGESSLEFAGEVGDRGSQKAPMVGALEHTTRGGPHAFLHPI